MHLANRVAGGGGRRRDVYATELLAYKMAAAMSQAVLNFIGSNAYTLAGQSSASEFFVPALSVQPGVSGTFEVVSQGTSDRMVLVRGLRSQSAAQSAMKSIEGAVTSFRMYNDLWEIESPTPSRLSRR